MSNFAGIEVIDIDKKLFAKIFFNKINDITINNTKYRFKEVPKDNNNNYNLNSYYSSLIIKYLCDEINIECCDVRLACLKNKLIILMPDYRKDGFSYINGQNLLDDYANIIEKYNLVEEYSNLKEKQIDNQYDRDILISDMYNLEVIWDALNYHYRLDEEYKRKDKIINIINEFVKRFCLDFLVMLDDRHVGNWEIEENEEIARLAPMFDNDSDFVFKNYNPNIKIDINSFFSKENQLEVYLKRTSKYFQKQFLNIYNILTPEKVAEILNKIEMERNMQFPNIYKMQLLENYSKNYEDITKLLIKLNLIEGGLKHE